jgi:L-ascorbate metabolism protein UlaG (beta-lactamase superfamily)
MDIQYHGSNCVTLTGKGVRLVVDDFMADYGLKPVAKDGDILLFTAAHKPPIARSLLTVDGPGEYEISNLAIVGIAARSHMDDPGSSGSTMYRVMFDDISYLFTGNVYPTLNDEQLEAIGMVDVMFVPVGGNGYTLDATGALQLAKTIEPKLVVPTHFADETIHYPVVQQDLDQVLKNIGMEPIETTTKLRYKPGDNNVDTQLVVLTRT